MQFSSEGIPICMNDGYFFTCIALLCTKDGQSTIYCQLALGTFAENKKSYSPRHAPIMSALIMCSLYNDIIKPMK